MNWNWREVCDEGLCKGLKTAIQAQVSWCHALSKVGECEECTCEKRQWREHMKRKIWEAQDFIDAVEDEMIRRRTKTLVLEMIEQMTKPN